MPVLTAAQVGTLQRAIAASNQVLPKLEMLEAIAQVNTAAQPRVAELRAKREYAMQLATTILTIERQLGGNVTVPTVQTSSGMVAPPAPAPSYTAPAAPAEPGEPQLYELYTGGLTRTHTRPTSGKIRVFIRGGTELPPEQEDEWLKQGYTIEFQPNVGFFGVKE